MNGMELIFILAIRIDEIVEKLQFSCYMIRGCHGWLILTLKGSLRISSCLTFF
jgi:hypothetical protein